MNAIAVPTAPRRERLIAILAVLAAVTMGYLAFKPAAPDSSADTATLSAPGFAMSYPEGWEQVDRVPPGMDAVLRREDGKAFLVVREEGPIEGNLARLTSGLDRELERRFEDFTKSQAQVVQLEAGRAFSYSYARTRAGTANSVVLVPAGERSYAIDTVVMGGSDDAARELGAIIRSFELK